MNKDELKARTKRFALRVLKLVDALPNSKSGRAIGGQLIRSGTSVGSNYRAACRGRSRAEFIAKIGVVEEEADESAFWLELIIDYHLMAEKRVRPLHREADELTATMAASRISASRNAKAMPAPNRRSTSPSSKSPIANRQYE
jgi:four helix bundle protein